MGRRVASIIVICAALGTIAVMSFSQGSGAPGIPSGIFHESVTADAGCRACHTPGRQAPLKDTHLPHEDCLSCHR